MAAVGDHGLELPRVVGHRGASAVAPENTLAAFREAHRQGAAWIEFDVRLARCGTPIVLHDAKLNRTSSGRGRASDLDAATIAACDAGSWFDPAFAGERIPTLAATLDLAATLRLGCNVELKAETPALGRATAAAVVPLLRPAAVPTLVSSFVAAALEEVRALASAMPIGVLVERRVKDRHLDQARDLGAFGLHADRRAYRDDTVALRIRDAGLWPVAYTVNDHAEARRLHLELGVATLISDRPGDLLTALAAQS